VAIDATDRPVADGALARAHSGEDLRRLGEALAARTQEVIARAGQRTEQSSKQLEPETECSFAKVGIASTVAVARWMAGESPEAVREVGTEAWRIFGQLAAQREAPLTEVTKRCLRWRDAAEEVLHEAAADLGLSPAVLAQAMAMLRRSLDVTLVRMCESFESERQSAQEELSRRQQQLEFQATHDALTGLPNRRLILDRIERMLERARRRHNPTAVLLIDLDSFTGINDSLGHAVAEKLLCAVAARLQGAVRDGDALGHLGGDVFVLMAGNAASAASPELTAERLLDGLQGRFELEGSEELALVVTASIGIATDERASAADLLRDAEIAMRHAKWAGHDGYVVFEPEMQNAVQRRMALEMDLRVALERDEFVLVYQPTFDLHGLTPTGVEALLRWSSPSRGTVSPAEFVPLLEETGLIVEVGRWVLTLACRQAAAWRAAGHPIGLAVNVSGRQLDRDAFVVEVEQALADSGLDPHALTLEITETALMRNVEQTLRLLLAIKQLGVRLAIDDFGTGYSSLAHLQRFPIDSLKIDRSFVSRLTQDRDGVTIVRTLVQLGKALSIETLAEGIEREEELSLLQAEGCDSGQGYLFARPLSPGDLETFLCTHETLLSQGG
jgi:diguanylate cyclase (GGDEF)-like protein